MRGWYVGTHKLLHGCTAHRLCKLELPHPNRSSIKLLQGHDKAKPKSLWDGVVLTTPSKHHDKKWNKENTHQQSIQSKWINGYLGVVGSTGSYGIYIYILYLSANKGARHDGSNRKLKVIIVSAASALQMATRLKAALSMGGCRNSDFSCVDLYYGHHPTGTWTASWRQKIYKPIDSWSSPSNKPTYCNIFWQYPLQTQTALVDPRVISIKVCPKFDFFPSRFQFHVSNDFFHITMSLKPADCLGLGWCGW